MANLPFWLEARLAEAPQAPQSFPALGGGMPGRDQYDPADLAALREQRGVRSAVLVALDLYGRAVDLREMAHLILSAAGRTAFGQQRAGNGKL
jgi:hypothetical protein